MHTRTAILCASVFLAAGLGGCLAVIPRHEMQQTPTPVPSAAPVGSPREESSPTTVTSPSPQPSPTTVSSPAPEARPTAAFSPTQVIREMLAQVNRDRALSDLRRLTGDEPICAGAECSAITDRATGGEGLRRAADYFASTLAGLGYSVEFQEWSREGYSDRNLIASKRGASAPSEKVYLVAHLDGIKPDAGDRSPAADDDASGAVALLELARVFSTHAFSRTVVLLFSTGEEEGTLGTQSYIDRLSRTDLASIKVAVSVEMLGYDANGDRVMELWHGGDGLSVAVTQMMSETIGAYQIGLVPRLLDGCG